MENLKFISNNQEFIESISPILEDKDSPVALDIESTGLDPFTNTIITIQLATPSTTNVYDVRKISEDKIKYLLELISNRTIIAHNAKFDVEFIYVKYGILFKNVYCTQVAESIINAGKGHGKYPDYKHKWRYSLSDLILKYELGKMDKDIRKDFIDNPDIVLTPELIDYGAKDVIYLATIRNFQRQKAEKKKLSDVLNMEMKLLPVIADMEVEGIALDKNQWMKMLEIAKEKVEELQHTMRELLSRSVAEIIEEKKFSNGESMLKFFEVPPLDKKVAYKNYIISVKDDEIYNQIFWENFNIDSPYQMKRILNLIGIPAKSTAADYLENHFGESDVAKCLIEYREWKKREGSFGENFFDHINPKTGKIHTEYSQSGAASGRFASSNPNLQNILAESGYRHAFVAEEGYLLGTLDYSQIELRFAADLANDRVMLDAFLEGKDLHGITSNNVFDVNLKELDENSDEYAKARTRAKGYNFSMLYKSSPMGISRAFQIPLNEAKEKHEKYRKTYPELSAFMELCDRKIWEVGYSVTPMGRKRYFIIPTDREWRGTKRQWKYKYKVLREGFNHIIQGGSADVIKLALIGIWYNNPFGNMLKILLTVHDEIVVKMHESIKDEATEFCKNQMILAGERFLKKVPVEVGAKVEPYWTK